MKLKHKLSLVLFLFFAMHISAMNVIVAKENIKYKEKINSSKLKLSKATKVKKTCEVFTLKMYNSNTYNAKHFIKKGSVLCLKDLAVYKKESIIFKFGSVQIEKEGKILFQNKKYITIKKNNGKIEKIYKDGSLK